jgi:hypothetical protein
MLGAVFVFTDGMGAPALRAGVRHLRAARPSVRAATFPAARDEEIERILCGVIAGVDFPLVISDEQGVPRAWRLVGLDPLLVPDASMRQPRGRPASSVR